MKIIIPILRYLTYPAVLAGILALSLEKNTPTLPGEIMPLIFIPMLFILIPAHLAAITILIPYCAITENLACKDFYASSATSEIESATVHIVLLITATLVGIILAWNHNARDSMKRITE